MSELVEGKIPAQTVCPYRDKCELAGAGACHHKGTEHSVPYYCAVARGFQIIHRNK